MKNLEAFGVQKLRTKDLQETNGGGIFILAIASFLLGRRVEYVKDGGGWTDYYL